jgi:hypothetical protein
VLKRAGLVASIGADESVAGHSHAKIPVFLKQKARFDLSFSAWETPFRTFGRIQV